MSGPRQPHGQHDEPGSALRIEWSPIHRPEWDEQPQEYVHAGLVCWGRSRRLAKAEDAALGFKAYIGIQHFDPAQWDLPGAPTAKFFASFLAVGHTAQLRTFGSLQDALAAVRRFHALLARRI